MLPTSRRLLRQRLPLLGARSASLGLRSFGSALPRRASANDAFANSNNAFYAEEMYRAFKQVSQQPFLLCSCCVFAARECVRPSLCARVSGHEFRRRNNLKENEY